MKYYGWNCHWSNYRPRPKLANVREAPKKRYFCQVCGKALKKVNICQICKEEKGSIMSIYKKILAVQMEAETIPKSGYNSFNKYKYSTEADVLAVKALMNKHGLIAYPDTVGFETLTRGEAIQIIQHIEYTVVDAETGESIKVKVLGQGEDKGDKGSYKAATGANKYFYLKFAGCATGDDPEKEEPAAKLPPAQKKYDKPKAVEPQVSPLAEASRLAAEIGRIMKDNHLTPEEITNITGLGSLNAAAQKGDVKALQAGKDKLLQYLMAS